MQQKIQDSYGKGFFGDLARFGGNITHELGKQAATRGLNMLTGYGGTALYYSDIVADQYKQNINEGYNEQDALSNALIKGGANYIKQRLLGGTVGKYLTGSTDTTWLEKTLIDKYSQAISDPTILSLAVNSSVEGLDELTDTWVEGAIDSLTLGKDFDPKQLFIDSLYSAGVGAATGGVGGATDVKPEMYEAILKNNPRAQQIMNDLNLINEVGNANQNVVENQQPTTQTETPQIQTNEQENINTQPRLEQAQIDLNEANNEATRNNEQIEQDLIREINKEQQKLDNGKSEDDGYHLAELQKELQDRRKNSIANDSNTFNLNKIDERNTLESIRSKEDISDKKVNAYQYDNPEVRPYFQEMAGELSDALNNFTQNGERFMREDGSWGGQKFSSTPEITELHNDYKMSLKDIEKGIDGILEDTGKENNAASKKVELVIDKMLRNGYQNAFTGEKIGTDQNYLNTLSGQPTVNQNVDTDEELPFLTNEDTDRERIERENELKENNNLAETKSEDVIQQNKVDEKTDLKQETNNETENRIDEETDDDEEKIAEILDKMPEKEKVSKKDIAKDVAGELYRLGVSREAEIEKVGKKTKVYDLIYKLDRSRRVRSEAQQHIGGKAKKGSGQTDWNSNLYKNFTDENGNKVSMSLNTIREDAKKHGISEHDLNTYLSDYLNMDRFKEGKYVRGKNFTDEMSKTEIAKLDEKYKNKDGKSEINRIAGNVWQFEHNELKNLHDSGMIGDELYNKLADYEHYVRIQRAVPKNGKSKLVYDKNGNVTVDTPIQQAKGGNQDILPIMEGIASYTERMIAAERVNDVARELGKAISMGSNSDTVGSYSEESFGVNPEFVKSTDDGNYTLTYFQDGNAYQIPISKALYDGFVKNKTVSMLENSNAANVITYKPRKLSAMFRNMTTNYNPMFLFTNAFKDIGDAPFNSKYTTEFLKTYASMQTLKELTTNGGYNQLYTRSGGKDDSYFNQGEFTDKAKSKLGKAVETALTPIEKANEFVETAPRLTEFIATIKANGYEVNSNGELVLKNEAKAKGRTADSVLNEALYNAAEVTTNFKRGGDVSKYLNRNGATFLNASIQGFDKQVRNFKDAFTGGSKKAVVNLLAKAMIFGIAPTLINDAMYGDDDEYKEMQDYIKDNYYIFKGDNGTWVRIPKGRAMSVIGSAYRRTKDYTQGNKEAYKGYAKFALGQVAPNNPFESNILSPLSAVKKNESWSGSKIIPTSYEDKPTNEQYNEKTDQLSVALGGLLKDVPVPEGYENFKSPMGINYLIDQYTGGVGDFALPMITPKATGQTDNPLLQPFVSKFSADAAYSNKNVSQFYDTLDDLTTKKNSIKATEMDKARYNYLNSQRGKMAELYKDQSAIQSNTTLSNNEKYQKAREVQKEINELAKKSVEDLNNIKDNKYYLAIGSDIYYLKDNDDGTKSYVKDKHATKNKETAEKKGMALYDYYKQQYEKRKEKK